MTSRRKCTAATSTSQTGQTLALSGTAHPAASSRAVRPSSPALPADLPAAIADLERRIHSLSAYIDRSVELSPRELVTLVSLQGELTSRLGRLVKIWNDLATEEADELTAAINEALDLISDNWGVEL
jgi:hypothetical protein